jgi:hypothetical protein
LRFRLTVSLLCCRDVGSVDFSLSGPLPLSLVGFLACGLRLFFGCRGDSLCAVALAIDCTPVGCGSIAIAIFIDRSRSVGVAGNMPVFQFVAMAIFTHVLRSVALVHVAGDTGLVGCWAVQLDGPLDVVDGGWDALLAFPLLWSAVPQFVAVESVDSSCC